MLFPSGRLRLLAAITLVAGGLFVSGGRVAKAGQNGQMAKPVNVTAVALSPGSVLVSWNYLGDVATLDEGAPFTVYNDTTNLSQGTDATSVTILGLQANQTYKFRICADYDPGQACADDVSVTTQKAQTSSSSTVTPPIITGNDSGIDPQDTNTWIGLYWETNGDVHDYYEIYYEVKPASGNWQDPGSPERAPNGASQSYHQVSNLLPGTAYLFKVKACDRIIFGIGGTQCGTLSSVYQATTPFLPVTGGRPTPIVSGNPVGATEIDITWTTPQSDHNYDHYVVQYQAQAPAGGTAPPAKSDQVPFGFNSYQAINLTPSTTYSFTVQGCDLALFPTPGVDCASPSAPFTATTTNGASSVTTGGGTIIGNLKATISVTPPTINAGNTVTIIGSSFPLNDGPVNVGYSWSGPSPSGGQTGGSGGGVPVTNVSAQGTFTATLTIPSGIPPTTVTVSAGSKTASATATVQVVAPSSKGTLTLVYTPDGSTVTDFAPDCGCYTLSGINFTPGLVTIFLDSPQGSQLLTATVGADGTFSQPFDPTAAQIGGKYGQHTLVAVQNGNVAGQLAVTVDPPLHIG